MNAFAKNARQRWPGVFLWLLIGLSPWCRADCPAGGSLHWAQLKSVVDGDTLRLTDGRRVRLIAINTPELGHHGRPDQPLARRARTAVRDFFAGDRRVGLIEGEDARDHYGRYLAYVYRADGRSLSAYLLERGLGWRIAIPPDLRAQDCLAEREQRARKAGRGVWGEPSYRARPSAGLTPADSGFGLVTGTVTRVVKSGSGWWIELPGISLHLSRKDRGYFPGGVPGNWLHRKITVRGWIIDRSGSPGVKKHGYPPLMMSIRHPSMISVD